ncbi:MAG: MliC family protein [Methylococcaceae bacterium]
MKNKFSYKSKRCFTAQMALIITMLVFTGISCQDQKSWPKNTGAEKVTDRIINSVTFSCAGNKTIQVLFFADKAELTLSDGRHLLLLQVISASGARYANTDESFVFWNKGNTAFIEESHKTTFKDCIAMTIEQAPT